MWSVYIHTQQASAVHRASDQITHLALVARASWNSYDQRWPVGPTVRATECENEPEPVPANARLE